MLKMLLVIWTDARKIFFSVAYVFVLSFAEILTVNNEVLK